MNSLGGNGLWDDQDGFYYDLLHTSSGTMPLRARSVVGLLPLAAATTLGPETLERLPDFAHRLGWFLANRREGQDVVEHVASEAHAGWRLLSIAGEARLRRLLEVLLDEDEFLSPYGIRGLSRHHAEHPLRLELDGAAATLGYEPGEARSALFGGNSNWRGPIWFPINYILIEALRAHHRFFGDGWRVELPTGSGRLATLEEVADDLARRLVSIFLDEGGRRPVLGGCELFQRDAAWHDLIPFHEYFHGDTGAGLGASHQTGWTGLVANLIIGRGAKLDAGARPAP
jgi:hypothetical protein